MIESDAAPSSLLLLPTSTPSSTTPLQEGEGEGEATASEPLGPGVWSRLGQSLYRGLWGMGRGLSAALQIIDGDARRDLAQLPLLGLTLLGPRHVPAYALPDDGQRPLLFVHGLGGHRGNFWPMRAWLSLQGRRRGYAIGLTPGVSLELLGRELARFIDDVIAVNGLPEDAQVDVVAHSMGGVVARLALQEVSCRERVHTLVTLGTPHAGTEAARFGGTDRFLDLRPTSEVMRQLAHQLPWRGPTRLVCLWSAADPIMQPASTAAVAGADNRELAAHTHTDYLLRRSAWRAVLSSLA